MVDSEGVDDIGEQANEAILPPYMVRRDQRALHARIRVTPREGAVVILPLDSELDAEEIVRVRRDWIEDALADLAEQRRHWTAEPASLLPARIELPAIEQSWRVRYRPTASASARVTQRGRTLSVTGAVDGERAIRALQRWLQRSAVTHLPPLLAQESQRTGLTPTRCSIRGQQARWAGCSAAGHITLNRALLFLDAGLVRAVIRHELAHLSEPNHSRAFWRLLGELDPLAQDHAAALLCARDRVPGWAERRF